MPERLGLLSSSDRDRFMGAVEFCLAAELFEAGLSGCFECVLESLDQLGTGGFVAGDKASLLAGCGL